MAWLMILARCAAAGAQGWTPEGWRPEEQAPPPVDIATGREIPSEGYCDQPYIVKLGEGTWLCVMTTGTGHEGATGQHIVSCRSADRGRTWSALTDIEPADGPEASWAMPYRAGYGRGGCAGSRCAAGRRVAIWRWGSEGLPGSWR